jgi:hypothetical protein
MSDYFTSPKEQDVIPLLLLRWHYNPMQTFASIMDFSQSALFFDLSFQFLNLCKMLSSQKLAPVTFGGKFQMHSKCCS